jgi:hypothetical protein
MLIRASFVCILRHLLLLLQQLKRAAELDIDDSDELKQR